MNVMTDYRCPSCNCIMFGQHEVVSDKPKKTIKVCPSCKTEVQLQTDNKSNLVDTEYFWANAKEMK